MSKEGDRASVLSTTKVRTKIKGDASWLQLVNENRSKPQEEEKPWLAEVRASRLNGAPIESSPVSSPTKDPASPIKLIADRAPASGYLIRGVFTKTDNKTAPSPPASNGLSGSTTNYTKKPSESYKRIAPHTVRPTSDSPAQAEGDLSPEEHEKRMEAASNVLKTSSVRQRSFVLSAAKKYEATDTSPDTTDSASFVAKRVVILDDSDTSPDETPPTDTPTAPLTPAVPVTPTAPVPPTAAPVAEPEPQTVVQTSVKTSIESVNEPAAAAVEDVLLVPCPPEEVPLVSLLDDTPAAVSVKDVSPAPVKDAPSPVSLLDHDVPGVSVKESPPPESFELMKPGCTKVATPLPFYVAPVKDAPLPVSLLDDAPGVSVKEGPPESFELMKPGCTKVDTPLPVYVGEIHTLPDQEVPPRSPVPGSPVSVSPVPEPELEPEPEDEPELSTNHSSAVDTLTALSDTLIPFGTSSSRDAESVLTEELGPEDSQAEARFDDEPAPELSNCIVMTDDLLALTNGPEELQEPNPPSPTSWSQDLLSGPDSAPSNPAQTHDTLDLLADDIIPINTDARSSADPFDPYPIGTTSTNSTPDLLEPFSVHSINSPTDLLTPDSTSESSSPDISFYNVSGDVLDDLADDVIPINTDTERLSNRSWEKSWDTNSPEDTNTEKSQEDVPVGLVEDQQTLVTFETKSSENDSPWKKWTSPTAYAVDNTDEKDSAESETETQTDRETYNDPPELAMERADDEGTQSPDTESKKGCVYVKEYVNTRDGRSATSSPCTYCGELVGNDAKITIEHLNISCHPACFKCGVCSKPMGDLLFNMFLHGGTVHCETCYADVL